MCDIQVKVEFSGLSRILTGANDVDLLIPQNSTYETVIAYLAEEYPTLVGNIIGKDKKTLFPSNIFSREGKVVVQEQNMGDQPKNGEVLILLSLLAGG